MDASKTIEKTFEQRLQERAIHGVFGKVMQPKADSHAVGGGIYRTLGYINFNGEKNLGELGPVKSYAVNYDELRARSWQAMLESDVAQIGLNKFKIWAVGSGIRVQTEPIETVLKAEGITIDRQKFSEMVESRWKVYSNSKRADYSGMKSLNKIQGVAFKNAKVGGDVLVILRYKKKKLTVQLIDGAHVISPIYGSEFWPKELPDGNTIINGVELSPKGEHVAYYVRRPGMSAYLYETDRILAKSTVTGLTMAYLVYGSEYRLDNHRGLPIIAVVLETAKKLERYKEAAVAGAEERQKIPYTIEHESSPQTTGENPFATQTGMARAIESNNVDLPADSYDTPLSSRLTVSTNKTVVNMPIGSSLKSLEGKQELYFGEFFGANIDMVFATFQIPPEVALSKYNSNFSASRAALKDWENTLNFERNDFGDQFLKPIHDAWMFWEIYNSKISAPGYLEAVVDENWMVIDAYSAIRFTGTPVPHIDPLKEVLAEREKLGPAGANLPLTTLEAATEALNGGDSDQNMEQFSEEFDQSKKLGIKPEPEPVAPIPGGNAGNAADKKKKKKEALMLLLGED